MARIARLPERAYVAAEGPEAEKFLQGLITNDMTLLARQPAMHAGLLSPQGKILFEFIVVRTERGYDLETVRASVPDLLKRLALYKLRSKVEIIDKSASLDVYAEWDGQQLSESGRYPDPRLPGLGWRFAHEASAVIACEQPAAYHAHRIALGVPEAGMDYPLGDTFPHEACFDLLGGVSFEKGCFVGQEVVSRMQHRGSARKRFLLVSGTAPLPPPQTPITAGAGADAPAIGAMGSSEGTRGLALVRIDRAGEAMQKDTVIFAAGARVELDVPRWAPYTLSQGPRA